ncbi:MAG TPA: class I adenylate-forming enzyme family protein [Pseudonocardiaceae bacterium]|nr:class I adenylate-forming enzyme family protein [Pseudonocardiaceae bacterium]
MTTALTTVPWTSNNGIVLADLVPATLRRRWVERGYCLDRDLYTLFSEHVRAHPRRTAVIDAAGAIDYATLDARVCRIAAALADAGYGRRDIIGIQVPNGWRAVAAELAVAAVGAVALPYPAGRGRRDSVSLLGRSRASAAIVADVAGQMPLTANLIGLRPDLPDLRTVFVFGAAPDGCEPLDRWLADVDAADAGRRWRPMPVDPEAPARILVTSGSEAEPKMIAYSHNAMGGGRGNYIGALHHGSEPMRNLILVPLASSYGSCGTSVTLARHGGTVLLLTAFDPAAALHMITDHRPTHVFGVPTMLRRMADLPRTSGEDLSSLRAVVTSSSLLYTATVQACRARFGAPVVNIYGSADGINCHTAGGSCGSEACVGRPARNVADLRIADASGQPVPAGQEGEIWARGPMTPLCYVNAPELDARYRPPGGWVRSGDRGLFDQDGCLHYVDRIKQVVIRGGYNISPAEVERQINAHPGISDAACVAVADPDLGERLCVCIVPRPGTPPPTLTELTAFLERERGLERKKLPELLVTLPELPLGATGKLCRQTLTRLAASVL